MFAAPLPLSCQNNTIGNIDTTSQKIVDLYPRLQPINNIPMHAIGIVKKPTVVIIDKRLFLTNKLAMCIG